MRNVRGVDGRVWTVRRRVEWPRLRRFKLERLDTLGNLGALDVGGGAAATLGGVALLLLVALVVALFLPPVAMGAALPVIVVAAAFLIGRRWLVVAECGGERRLCRARGWRRVRAAVDEVARALEQGIEPPASV